MFKFEKILEKENDQIEKKTRELDKLNIKYDKITVDMEDASVGPLENTIKNMNKEKEVKKEENRHLQKIWIGNQVELVKLQKTNETLGSDVSTMKSKETVIIQKQQRLEQQ